MTIIHLITGGQRSGKSCYAEQLALRLSSHPIYMATAHVSDGEMAARVAHHQQRRGQEWTTIEEECCLSKHDLTGHVVLIDSLTTWLSNVMLAQHFPSSAKACGKTVDENEKKDDDLSWHDCVLTWICSEFDRLISQDATFIFVTDEVGMGGISGNALQRRFTDLQGSFNQYVAKRADEVVLMVSGIPMKVK